MSKKEKQLTKHCIVLCEDSKKAMEKIKRAAVENGNFRASYSMVVRWALLKALNDGSWEELYHIF